MKGCARAMGLASSAAILLFALSCGGDSTGPSTIQTLAMAQASLSLALQGETRLSAYARNAKGELIDNPAGLVWTSSDPDRVSVDELGNLKGLLLGGPVTITVRSGAASATAGVSVTPANVVISGVPTSVGVGESVQLSATPRNALGAAIPNVAVSWSADPVGVVTVSDDGVMTGVAGGMVSVIATALGRSDRADTGVPSPYDGAWEGFVNNNPAAPVRVLVQLGTAVQYSREVPVQLCTTLRIGATPRARIVSDRVTFAIGGNGSLTGTFTSLNTMTATATLSTYGVVTCDDGHQLSGFYNVGSFTITMTKP